MINYYDLLGVSRDASLKEINKAYKREASKWHPDKNSAPEAKERMQLINEARFILTDNDARTRYNRELEAYYAFKSEADYDKDYVFKDEILFKWMQNAKKQSKDLTVAAIDDLIGMSSSAVSAAYNKTKYLIAIYLSIIVLILMFR